MQTNLNLQSEKLVCIIRIKNLLILGISPVVGPSGTANFSPLSSFLPPDMDLAIIFLPFPFLLLMGLISRYIFGTFLACASVAPIFSSDFLMGLQFNSGPFSVATS